MNALRATIARFRGAQASSSTPLDRVRLMRRHVEAIEADLRHGMTPAPTHLAAIAAHALILHGEINDDE